MTDDTVDTTVSLVTFTLKSVGPGYASQVTVFLA